MTADGSKFGSIGDELDAAARARRPDLTKLRSRELPDEVAESNARQIGATYGAATSLEPAPAPIASLRLEIPAYLDDQLRIRAAEEEVSKTYLVLSALSAAGFTVHPADLVADRRKARSRRSTRTQQR